MTTKSDRGKVFKCVICEREQLADIGETAALAAGWTKHDIDENSFHTGYFWLCPFCSDEKK